MLIETGVGKSLLHKPRCSVNKVSVMFAAKRILLLVLCAAICGQCAVAQRDASKDRQSFSLEQLVDLGGRRLYIKCSGDLQLHMHMV